MRVERCADGTHKVWMSLEEVQELRRHATGYRDDVVVGLGARSGLRSFEVPQIRPRHVKRTTHDGGDYYFLRVPEGKDTANGEGKPRDAYLPRELERDLYRYIEAEGIGRDEPIVDVSERTVQRIVKKTARAAAEATGDEDYRKVSSHDLRRHFANHLLVEERMNPEVVMEVGGWDDYEALKPYLSKPTTGTIVDEFERADLA